MGQLAVNYSTTSRVLECEHEYSIVKHEGISLGILLNSEVWTFTQLYEDGSAVFLDMFGHSLAVSGIPIEELKQMEESHRL